eukprot:UN22595
MDESHIFRESQLILKSQRGSPFWKNYCAIFWRFLRTISQPVHWGVKEFFPAILSTFLQPLLFFEADFAL